MKQMHKKNLWDVVPPHSMSTLLEKEVSGQVQGTGTGTGTVCISKLSTAVAAMHQRVN